MSRMRVALFESPAEAEPMRQRLVRAGIRAELHQASGLAKLWFVSKRQTGVRLEVPTRDAAQARQLLIDWDAEERWIKNPIRCPECRSMRIDYPQFTEKSLLTNLAVGLMAGFHLIEREYYCQDCHCMWAKPGAKPARFRAHTAPNYFLEVLKQEMPTEAALCRAKPNGVARDSLKAPRWQKCPAVPNTTRFRIFKLWRRILGVAFLLGGVWLVPGSSVSLFATEASTASASTGTPEFSGNGSAAKAVVSPPKPASPDSEKPTYLRDVLPILMGKCARCHNQESPVLQNWLDYRKASARRLEIKRRVWDSWRGAYFRQVMPVANSPESESMTDEERATIRDWVKSGAAQGVMPQFSSAQSKAERLESGKHLFSTICAACHQPGGQGIPGRFPPLAGSDFLNSDKHRAIRVVINGLQGEVTVNGRKFNNSMPRFPLSDHEIASALTYVYNSFGNSGKEVSAQEVSAARAEKEELDLASHNQSAKIPEEKSPFE